MIKLLIKKKNNNNLNKCVKNQNNYIDDQELDKIINIYNNLKICLVLVDITIKKIYSIKIKYFMMYMMPKNIFIKIYKI